jgi:hypothetical protein
MSCGGRVVKSICWVLSEGCLKIAGDSARRWGNAFCHITESPDPRSERVVASSRADYYRFRQVFILLDCSITYYMRLAVHTTCQILRFTRFTYPCRPNLSPFRIFSAAMHATGSSWSRPTKHAVTPPPLYLTKDGEESVHYCKSCGRVMSKFNHKTFDPSSLTQRNRQAQ